MSEILFKGGARVPIFFYCPEVTKANTLHNSIVQSTDLFLTLIEIVGGEVSENKNLDGISLLASIKSDTTINQDAIFGYSAYEDVFTSVREGDWKLSAYRSEKLQLYNSAKDNKEVNNRLITSLKK
jgi:arylsulfatase A-like enzyme